MRPHEHLLIEAENAHFMGDNNVPTPVAVLFDNHRAHIEAHRRVMTNASAKNHVKAIVEHMEEHWKLLNPETVERMKKGIQFDEEVNRITNDA